MQIVQAPAEILRTPTKPVALPMEKLFKIIEEMKQVLLTQKDPEGVGLAANQVGLPYSLFLGRFTTKKNETIRVFINPEVIEHSQELHPSDDDKKSPLEGCLSRPNYYGTVKRWKWIKLKYYATPEAVVSSQWTEDRFEDFAATVIQHEMDHLNGKLFVERILEQKGKLYRIVGKDAKGKEKWEEVEF